MTPPYLYPLPYYNSHLTPSHVIQDTMSIHTLYAGNPNDSTISLKQHDTTRVMANPLESLGK